MDSLSDLNAQSHQNPSNSSQHDKSFLRSSLTSIELNEREVSEGLQLVCCICNDEESKVSVKFYRF